MGYKEQMKKFVDLIKFLFDLKETIASTKGLLTTHTEEIDHLRSQDSDIADALTHFDNRLILFEKRFKDIEKRTNKIIDNKDINQHMLDDDKRKSERKPVDIETQYNYNKLYIIDMGENSIGFFSNDEFLPDHTMSFDLKQNNSEENITCIIKRCSPADESTGYKFFHGAEISHRETTYH